MSLRILTRSDVSKLTSKLSPELLQSIMEDVFALISSGSHDMPPKSYTPHRITIPTENHKALFMPARISSVGTAMKVVAVPLADSPHGLPASTLILDKETGAVKCIVNATSLTALRNAAGSLLSTTLVGPVKPTHIVAFGAGQQIHAHLDIFCRAFPSIQSCTIINRTLNERLVNLLSQLLASHPSVEMRTLYSDEGTDRSSSRALIKEALSKASIVITATSSCSPLFPSSWIRTGTHVILIGSYTPQMKEVDVELIARGIPSSSSGNTGTGTGTSSPILLVDSIEACFTEAGELLEAGLHPDQVVEIGKLVLEKRRNMKSPFFERDNSKLTRIAEDDFTGPVTIFKSVGVGLQDVAIACAVVDKAEELERLSGSTNTIGTVVPDYD
ncbi:hypothetical protein D9757_001537 [Collybiopsis confluens]|uniref:NAD(P)-binding protein n=1 Tax=Collybiopsis confluens TaxID=2823264 RepID=A0A8H5HZ37_9AGAR|nr:hypothetical protein D9757_001537 [Collybiopsis confluens]